MIVLLRILVSSKSTLTGGALAVQSPSKTSFQTRTFTLKENEIHYVCLSSLLLSKDITAAMFRVSRFLTVKQMVLHFFFNNIYSLFFMNCSLKRFFVYIYHQRIVHTLSINNKD
jgi:hypothetical protein